MYSRLVLVLIAVSVFPACQISLLSEQFQSPIEGGAPKSSRTLAIPAPEYTRLHGTPEHPASRIRVRIVFADGSESALTFESGTSLTESLVFILPRSDVTELRKVGVYRDLDPAVFVVSDVGQRRRYGDLQQDLILAEGDLIFIPRVSDSILQEFFSASGILASE